MRNKIISEILGISKIDSEKSYRQKAIDKATSNNGWYKCRKCGGSFRLKDMDADHILPKSLGGSNDKENLQLICKHCNRSKSAKTDDTLKDFKANIKDISKKEKAQEKDNKRFLKKMF